jgi:hypothetical protein
LGQTLAVVSSGHRKVSGWAGRCCPVLKELGDGSRELWSVSAHVSVGEGLDRVAVG